VNFFGHSVIARLESKSPAFGFGAMLPDLATMLGHRRIHSADAAVARGIRFHHVTDLVFHEHTLFAELQNQARRELRTLGVARGPRLGVAHVGLELMLDAEFAAEPSNVTHYVQALNSLGELDGKLSVGDGSSGFGNLVQLGGLLLQRLPSLVPHTPDELFERLARVLAHRPALCLDEADRPAVTSWATTTWQTIRARKGEWLEQIEVGLRSHWRAENSAEERDFLPNRVETA
jgi:hypothetical protein